MSVIRPFFDTLRHLEYGGLLERLSGIHYNLVGAVDETKKPATLTIQINYRPTGQGRIGMKVKVTDKPPTEDSGETVLFIDDEGNTLVDNPRQRRLDIGEVDAGNNNETVTEVS